MTQDQESITFNAIFSKATTTIDGGWNITFAVAQDEAHKVVNLAALRETLFKIQICFESKKEDSLLDDIY